MSSQNVMRSEIRTKPTTAMEGAPLRLEQFLPYQLDVVATEILTPSDREAFQRALQRITDRSAQLVAEAITQNGTKSNARVM
jgi:hypothetical protein